MKEKKEKFIRLIKDHQGILFKIINAYCKDSDDQKDLEQEILIQLWKAIDRFDGSSQWSTWIYRIALNVSISFFRKEQSRLRQAIWIPIDEQILTIVEDEHLNPELEARVQFLYSCIRELDSLNRALIVLYLEKKSYREISEILGITVSNAATKIGRIKKVFKDKFNQSNYGKE